MKPIVICSCLALAALSLYAADPQTTNPAPQPLQLHTAKLLSSTQTANNGDSPLVRAAKATGRLNKKPGQVITNETLVHAGGHFTTTTPSAQSKLPANGPTTAPTMDQLENDQRRARLETAIAAELAKKFAAQQNAAAGLAAARAEGDTPQGLYADPPVIGTSGVPVVNAVSPETMTTNQSKPPL